MQRDQASQRRFGTIFSGIICVFVFAFVLCLCLCAFACWYSFYCKINHDPSGVYSCCPCCLSRNLVFVLHAVQALNKALLHFHSIKMREINEVLKEYWRATYRGRDIDEIAIRSDPAEEKGGRRVYNYRVVMKKGKLMWVSRLWNKYTVRVLCTANCFHCLICRGCRAEHARPVLFWTESIGVPSHSVGIGWDFLCPMR